jgi:hypothetical protein
MPVIQVTALPQRPGTDVSKVLTTLCREVAAALGEEERGVWATWQQLEAGAYAEAGDARSQQPAATHPPIARVIAFRGRSPDVVERMLETVAAVLVRELSLEDGNAFVLYEEALRGRLYTGGAIAT